MNIQTQLWSVDLYTRHFELKLCPSGDLSLIWQDYVCPGPLVASWKYRANTPSTLDLLFQGSDLKTVLDRVGERGRLWGTDPAWVAFGVVDFEARTVPGFRLTPEGAQMGDDPVPGPRYATGTWTSKSYLVHLEMTYDDLSGHRVLHRMLAPRWSTLERGADHYHLSFR